MYFQHQFWFCWTRNVWKCDARGRRLLPEPHRSIGSLTTCQKGLNESHSVTDGRGLESFLPDSCWAGFLLRPLRSERRPTLTFILLHERPASSVPRGPELSQQSVALELRFLLIVYPHKCPSAAPELLRGSRPTWIRELLMIRLTSSLHSGTSGLCSSRLEEKASRWDRKYSAGRIRKGFVLIKKTEFILRRGTKSVKQKASAAAAWNKSAAKGTIYCLKTCFVPQRGSIQRKWMKVKRGAEKTLTFTLILKQN